MTHYDQNVFSIHMQPLTSINVYGTRKSAHLCIRCIFKRKDIPIRTITLYIYIYRSDESGL